MAVTRVQTLTVANKPDGSGTTATNTLANVPTQGNVVVCGLMLGDNGSSSVSIADNFGDAGTWVPHPANPQGYAAGCYGYLWYKVVGTPSGGGKAVTITLTNTQNADVFAGEYGSTGTPSWAVDGTPVAAFGDSSALPNAGGITVAGNEVVLVAVMSSTGGLYGAGSGYTRQANNGSWTNNAIEDRIVTSSPGTYQTNWVSGGGDDNWQVVAFALRADGGGGAGNQELTPSLFTNTNTFYSPNVSRGAVGLTPSLYTNTQTFHAPTVSTSYALTPALFTNSQTFYSPTVSVGAVNLAPSLFTNTNTFYSPTVDNGASGIFPELFVNSQTFYGPTITTGAVGLTPSLYTNNQTFYGPTVVSVYTLAPSLFTNTQTFYSPTVTPGAVTLLPELFVNQNGFYPATVTGGEPVVVTSRAGGGLSSSRNKKRAERLVIEFNGKDHVIPVGNLGSFLEYVKTATKKAEVKPVKPVKQAKQKQVDPVIEVPEIILKSVPDVVLPEISHLIDNTNELLQGLWERAYQRYLEDMEDEEQLLWLMFGKKWSMDSRQSNSSKTRSSRLH